MYVSELGFVRCCQGKIAIFQACVLAAFIRFENDRELLLAFIKNYLEDNLYSYLVVCCCFVFSIFLVLNFEIKKDNIERPYIALENDLSKETPLICVSTKKNRENAPKETEYRRREK